MRRRTIASYRQTRMNRTAASSRGSGAGRSRRAGSASNSRSSGS